MRTVCVTLPATLLPHHNAPHETTISNRCVSLSSPTMIKSQLSFPRRQRFRYTSRSIPGYRTPEEYSEGHVVGAVNVPYMLRVGQGMSRNPNFLEEVSTRFDKYDEVIVGCQLGKRSLMAAAELLSAGFTGITDMAGGYAAWTQNGLPVE